MEIHDNDAINYLLEAKQAAEFLNENFYIMMACVALGDYYYNNISYNKKALIEYLKARQIAVSIGDDVKKIDNRIQDMKLRMNENEFKEIENKYGQN